jgi:uncharacterized membrane protein (DUF4010 family)
MAAPAAVAVIAAAIGARRASAKAAREMTLRNPLQLANALQMAAIFQAVLMLVYVIRERWESSGLFTYAAAMGLTDVDALTVSITRGMADAATPSVAATAIGIGVLSNTAMKLGLAVVLGNETFRLVAGGALLLMFLALGAVLIVWPVR